MRAAVAVALAALLAACGGDDRPVFAPIIDAPAEGSDAYPYTGVDELVLEIAPAGRDRGVSDSFAIGEPLELPDIDYGEQLVVHLTGLTRGVEVAYGRSCAVDVTAASVDQAPHLWFSRMVKWGEGPAPGAIDQAASLAYSLPDGSGVFVGEGRVTRFDPAVSGLFHDVEIDPIAPRDGGILAALPDGRAVLIGGVRDGDGVPLVEAIDPNEQPVAASRLEAQPGPPLRDHAAVTLVDGTVLVVGGELQEGEGFAVTRAAWLVQFGDGNTLDEPEQLVSLSITGRAGHTLTRLGDDVGAAVVVIGGRDRTLNPNPVATTELYRPLSKAFEPIATAALTVPRWNHRAVRLPDGSVLVIGGRTVGGAAALPVERYDPVVGAFKDTDADLIDAVEDMAVVPLPDGRVLLIGGSDADGRPVSTVLIASFDPVDGTVVLSETDPLEQPRAGHSAAILCDGTILVAGGGPGSERYNPPSAGRR